MSDDEELEECDGCRFPGLPLKDYNRGPFNKTKESMRLCGLCAETFIGNSVQYPDQYEHREVMQLIGFCTNKILQKLRRCKGGTMKAGFSKQLNERFTYETSQKDALDVAVVWIGDNLLPDDVFSDEILEQWADDAGYTRED